VPAWFGKRLILLDIVRRESTTFSVYRGVLKWNRHSKYLVRPMVGFSDDKW
jgi:hypothetical protein